MALNSRLLFSFNLGEILMIIESYLAMRGKILGGCQGEKDSFLRVGLVIETELFSLVFLSIFF